MDDLLPMSECATKKERNRKDKGQPAIEYGFFLESTDGSMCGTQPLQHRYTVDLPDYVMVSMLNTLAYCCRLLDNLLPMPNTAACHPCCTQPCLTRSSAAC